MFTSDGSISFAGWEAVFSCTPMPPNDVSLESIDSPSQVNCSYGNSIDFTVANNGSDTLNSFQISLYHAGTASLMSWSGAIPPFTTVQITIPGPYTFNEGDSLGITLTNPIGMVDANPINNSKRFKHYLALSGTYKVGYGVNNSDSIADLNTAVNLLNQRGVCGDVYFDIKPGIYTGRYTINQFPEIGQNPRITFRSETKNPTDVILTDNPTSAATNYIFKLNGADHVQLKQLTLSTSSSAYRTIIDLTNGAHYFTLDSCILYSDTTMLHAIFPKLYA